MSCGRHDIDYTEYRLRFGLNPVGPPCGVVEEDGECDEGAVAVHLRLHRGLHPAHGHGGGGGRRNGRRGREEGVGLCGFGYLSDD